MATWEDGPEYAPVERPGTFAAPPTVSPLEKAPPRRAGSAAAPLAEPRFHQRAELPPLVGYHPDPGPQRDPREPYAVAASVMTEVDSAWSTVVHYHVQPDQWTPSGPPLPIGPPPPDPRAPILVAGAPLPPGLAPGPPGPLGPPGPSGPPGPMPPSPTQPEWLPSGPVLTESRSPAFGAVFNAVTAPTFITLLLGGLAMAVPLFGWLSPLMFVLAFLTSGRIAYRRHWIRLAFLVGTGALGTTIIVGVLFSPADLLAYFELVQAVSTVACWLVLFAVLGIVWQALAAGEPPDHPAPRHHSGFG